MLTISCFIFVELALLSKIILRITAIVGLNQRYPGRLEDVLNEYRGKSSLVCAYDLSFLFGILFFTIALIFNAVKWVHLILFIQKNSKPKFY